MDAEALRRARGGDDIRGGRPGGTRRRGVDPRRSGREGRRACADGLCWRRRQPCSAPGARHRGAGRGRRALGTEPRSVGVVGELLALQARRVAPWRCSSRGRTGRRRARGARVARLGARRVRGGRHQGRAGRAAGPGDGRRRPDRAGRPRRPRRGRRRRRARARRGEVLAAAEERHAGEVDLLERLGAGESTLDAMGLRGEDPRTVAVCRRCSAGALYVVKYGN